MHRAKRLISRLKKIAENIGNSEIERLAIHLENYVGGSDLARRKKLISTRINAVITKPDAPHIRTLGILGCNSRDEFVEYLNRTSSEIQIGDPNYSIDHIIPRNYAVTDEDLMILSHHHNLRLMDFKENSLRQDELPDRNELPAKCHPPLLDFWRRAKNFD